MKLEIEPIVKGKGYEGKYVILDNFNGKVIASDKDVGKALAKAKKLGIDVPVIVFVPRSDVTYIW